MPEKSAWDEGVVFPQFPALTQSLTTDVLIIGGGLAGVTTAYFLVKAGYEVVLIEKDRLGQGATGLTTAFLTQYIDTDLVDMLRIVGREKMKALLGSQAMAIDMVEEIVRTEKIECDFKRCANYIYARSEDERELLQHEYQSAREVSLPVTLNNGGLPFRQRGFLELPHQAKFHPLKYLAALVKILQERGVNIYEGTEAQVLEIEKSPHSAEASRGREIVKIETSDGREIKAKHIVVATYAPFDKELFFKKAQYTSYILEARVPTGILPEAIFEDMANPYHYWRIDRGESHDRIIFGGADHRSDIPVNAEKSWQALVEEMSFLFADIPFEIVGRWRGPILETVDGLPYIGSLDDPRVFYATGFSGNGMTYATIAAQIITGALQSKVHPWQVLYDAERTPGLKALLIKGRDYSEEMVGGAVRNTFTYRT